MIENIRLSIKGIISHKMRSVLTMLGIIIGISSVIVIVSIIESVTNNLKDEMVGDNTNTITLSLYDKNDSWSPYDISMNGTIPGISVISDDAMEKVEAIEGVVKTTPIYSSSAIEHAYNAISSYSSVYGVREDFFEMKNLILTSGRLFIDNDYENKNNVVILSSEAEGELFKNESSLGKTIILGSDTFVVVGVVTRIKDYSDINSFGDYATKIGLETNELYIPTTSWDLIRGYDDIQSLVIKFESVDDTVMIESRASSILNKEIPGEKFEYKSGSMSENAEYLETTAQVASILLGGIASISLIVGGIGVMNIMLVSVTERTREIGLKKALGANNKVIRAQFLTEAVVLTSLGGILGVLIGIGISFIVSRVIQMPMAINAGAIAVSVVFSMLVGIIFGWIPSRKASKLDPIEALRYE